MYIFVCFSAHAFFDQAMVYIYSLNYFLFFTTTEQVNVSVESNISSKYLCKHKKNLSQFLILKIRSPFSFPTFREGRAGAVAKHKSTGINPVPERLPQFRSYERVVVVALRVVLSTTISTVFAAFSQMSHNYLINRMIVINNICDFLFA